jgi:hypothetical protein
MSRCLLALLAIAMLALGAAVWAAVPAQVDSDIGYGRLGEHDGGGVDGSSPQDQAIEDVAASSEDATPAWREHISVEAVGGKTAGTASQVALALGWSFLVDPKTSIELSAQYARLYKLDLGPRAAHPDTDLGAVRIRGVFGRTAIVYVGGGMARGGGGWFFLPEVGVKLRGQQYEPPTWGGLFGGLGLSVEPVLPLHLPGDASGRLMVMFNLTGELGFGFGSLRQTPRRNANVKVEPSAGDAPRSARKPPGNNPLAPQRPAGNKPAAPEKVAGAQPVVGKPHTTQDGAGEERAGVAPAGQKAKPERSLKKRSKGGVGTKTTGEK